jgi:uncharacterized protein (TIRG00374 family)
MQSVKNILKIVISLGLLGYLIYKAEPARVLAVFAKIQSQHGLGFLLLSFAVMLIAVFFLAVRWRVLLKGYGYDLSIKKLYGFYLVGMFFNNFLPSSIGGDVMRIYNVIEATGDRTTGFASVVLERIMGIAATLALAIWALFYVSQQFHDARILLSAIGLFVLILLFFLALLHDRSFQLIFRLFDKFTVLKIGEKFNKLFEAVRVFKSKRSVLVWAFLLSLISQSFIVLMNYFLSLAFSIHVSLGYLFMVVPVTFVITMLPSINGLGIRDLGFVGLLGQIGVGTAEALSLSFMNVIVPMIISIAGGIIFMIQKRKDKVSINDVLEKDV